MRPKLIPAIRFSPLATGSQSTWVYACVCGCQSYVSNNPLYLTLCWLCNTWRLLSPLWPGIIPTLWCYTHIAPGSYCVPQTAKWPAASCVSVYTHLFPKVLLNTTICSSKDPHRKWGMPVCVSPWYSHGIGPETWVGKMWSLRNDWSQLA